MPLTPQEVAGKVFGPTRMRRGYDEHEVDAFLDEVEAELTRLTTENEQLRKDLDKARRGIMGTPPEEASIPDATVAQSAAVAPEVAPAAPSRSAHPDEIAVEHVAVEQRVTRMIVLAQQTADAALHEAQGEADRTRVTARNEAERMLADARNRVAEELGGLERSKNALENEVAQLTAFEQEYRQRLRVFLEGRLHDLDHALAGVAAVEGQGRNSLDAGPVDPPGFGAVWSPEDGSHSGVESASNGYDDEAIHSDSPFDTGSEGSRSSSMG